MNFIETILNALSSLMSFIGQSISNLGGLIIDLLSYPIHLIIYLLEGIFHLLIRIFEISILIIQIFIATFQFLMAITAGLFQTIFSWLNPTFTGSVNFPSTSETGFTTVINVLAPTGLMDTAPMILLVFIWIGFILKMIGLIGGTISVRSMGGS